MSRADGERFVESMRRNFPAPRAPMDRPLCAPHFDPPCERCRRKTKKKKENEDVETLCGEKE